jgi:hypothetical protein
MSRNPSSHLAKFSVLRISIIDKLIQMATHCQTVFLITKKEATNGLGEEGRFDDDNVEILTAFENKKKVSNRS